MSGQTYRDFIAWQKAIDLVENVTVSGPLAERGTLRAYQPGAACDCFCPCEHCGGARAWR